MAARKKYPALSIRQRGEAYSILSEHGAQIPPKIFKAGIFGGRKVQVKTMGKLAFWNRPKGTFPFSKKFALRFAFARSLLQESMNQRLLVTKFSQELNYYSDVVRVMRQIKTLEAAIPYSSPQNRELLGKELKRLRERFSSQDKIQKELANATKRA